MSEPITTVAQLVYDTLKHTLKHGKWISKAIHTLSLEETLCTAMEEACRDKGLAVEAWEVAVLENGPSASAKQRFQAVEVDGVWISLTSDASSGTRATAFESLGDFKSACLALVNSQDSSGLVGVTSMKRLAFKKGTLSDICHAELTEEMAGFWAGYSAHRLSSSWVEPGSFASPKPRM